MQTYTDAGTLNIFLSPSERVMMRFPESIAPRRKLCKRNAEVLAIRFAGDGHAPMPSEEYAQIRELDDGECGLQLSLLVRDTLDGKISYFDAFNEGFTWMNVRYDAENNVTDAEKYAVAAAQPLEDAERAKRIMAGINRAGPKIAGAYSLLGTMVSISGSDREGNRFLDQMVSDLVDRYTGHMR